MSSVEARRIARQKKILGNQEGRMKRITLDQKIEPSEPSEPSSTSVPSAKREPDIFEEHFSATLLSDHLESPDTLENVELFQVPPPLLSNVQHLPNADHQLNQILAPNSADELSIEVQHSFLQHWSGFLIWFILGILIRLLLSSPDFSWVVAGNALSPFFVLYLLTHFGFRSLQQTGGSEKTETTAAGMGLLALRMCGLQPEVINRLKRLNQIWLDLAQKFSVYFVAFVICHMIV